MEFVDSAGRSLGTFTVNEEQIEEWDAENERAD